VALVAVVGLGSSVSRAAERFVFHHENVMGTSLELQVVADREADARWAEAQVLAEIDRMSAIASSYDASSEMMRWQATRDVPVRLSSELAALLQESERWRELSHGAFDVRIAVFSDLWARSERTHRLPSRDQLALAASSLSQPAWHFVGTGTDAVHTSGCPLSLNAIAKGDIVERACRLVLRPERGIRGVLLNVGGDLRADGALRVEAQVMNPARDSESSEPLTRIHFQNRAVSTSGSSQRGYRIQGCWYSHIIDPRSGLPADEVSSATVIAERSSDADALATICNVLGPGESLSLVDSVPGAACLVIDRDGRQYRSALWRDFESPRATGPLAEAPEAGSAGVVADDPPHAAAATNVWDPDFELVLSFEIKQPVGAGRGYRRPYVVAWIEDGEGRTVRTLILWVSLGGAGPGQWLPDLRRWYRGDDDELADKKNLVSTVARPTRPPGRYTAIWDGKDDRGQLVSKGKYTLLVDSAREHGTYQHMRKSLDLSDRPISEELTGNEEIGSAKVEYRRRVAPDGSAR
jgi:thiamine biosynthesis lipoprotein ApbE